ncbi:MAG: alpha/beta fold hydrolase [Actinomycetota bacterium]
MEELPPVRFAEARDGARIAYQEWGSGPPVVAIPPAAQNIELAWEWPGLRTMFDRFGTFCRYVHYDKRGTGASDRTVRVPHVDVRVDDLRAVMDATGIERAHLFSQSEGGVTTLLFAAAYPHRVESLIMLGSPARLVPPDVELTDEVRADQREKRRAFARAWGTPDEMATALFAPSRIDDAEFRSWFVRYQRFAASSDSLFELFMEMLDLDAHDVVSEIEAPILAMSRADDASTPIELAKEVADLARDATFIELPGIDHFSFLGDVDAWLDPMERWVTGEVQPREPSRGPVAAHVTTLGRFAVEVDGREVETGEWGSRRARTLLKRLVTARGWPVTRDELFDLLWPDEIDRARLGARLSVQLSHVRRVLGGGVIADRDTIALDRSHVSTDLERLLGAEDDERIIELDAGEFLPEDRYEDWTTPVREQVRSTVVSAIRRRLAALEADGGTDSPEAVRLAARHDELESPW